MGPSSAKECHREGGGMLRQLSILAASRPEVVMQQNVAMSFLDAQGASHLSILIHRPEAHHGHGAGSPRREGTGCGRWPPLSLIRITRGDSYLVSTVAM